jgi:hypothetical protein
LRAGVHFTQELTGTFMGHRNRVLLASLIAAASVHLAAAQSLGGCAMFPSNNIWNARVDQLPVDANSSAYVTTIGASKGLHPDFSQTGSGIPFVIVPGTQPKVPVSFTYESDPGPYPVPPNAPIEGGAASTGDRHVLVLENSNCILYEMYAAYPQPDGSWTGGSGAVFDLKSNQLRPAGWTSADAAGLPILPGLVRYDEVASGEIRHAIRMTAPQTRNQYIWPARHRASTLTGTQYPPMGQRFRLKAGFDISPYPADVQVILKALKTYGMLLADNGSSWYLTGAPDPNWNDTSLHTLQNVLGSNIEAVDESSLMVSPDSAAVPTALALSGVQLNPASIVGGSTSTLNQVVLSVPAPAGGVTVTLGSSAYGVASVAGSLPVLAGATSAYFDIQTFAVATATPVAITASYLGVSKTASLTVNAATVTVASLTVSPNSLTGGANATGAVTLSGAAPAGGAVVSIANSDTATASAPATVIVPAGATSMAFAVSTISVTATKIVNLTASYGGVSRAASLTVNPKAVTVASLSISPSSLTGGASATGAVTLSGAAPAGGAVVSIANSDTATASAPATVTVPAGATSASFAVSTRNVSAVKTVTLTATYGGVSRTASLTVNPKKRH